MSVPITKENAVELGTRGGMVTRERSQETRDKAPAIYLSTKCNTDETCKLLGITRRLFNTWLTQHPDFKEQIEEANEALTDHVETVLHSLIDSEDFSSVQFYLKSKAKSRGYSDKADSNQVSQINIQWMVPDAPIHVQHVDGHPSPSMPPLTTAVLNTPGGGHDGPTQQHPGPPDSAEALTGEPGGQ